jgi:2-dehydro-3-deoxyphosphogluconate aldolase/(4S)-4-hydroxy-2-oxoglutarate aldolase
MARFTRMQVLNELIDIGLIPLFYNPDVDLSIKIIKACEKGGARAIEFTNRGDHAWEVFTEVEKQLRKDDSSIILGVGTVDDAPTAAIYIACGANFVVSPNFNEEVARLCNRHKVAYFPGCATVTEIANAEEFGVEICKAFPGSQIGGPAFIKAVMGPRPHTRIMPTGGVDVTKENIFAWIQAGACCLGMGSKLIRKDRIQAGEFNTITEDVKRALQLIREARQL